MMSSGARSRRFSGRPGRRAAQLARATCPLTRLGLLALLALPACSVGWENGQSGPGLGWEGLEGEDRARWERILTAGDYLAEHLAEAPVILMFVADFRAMAVTDAKLDRISLVGGGSVYPPVQNAMLACVAEGLGCTLTTLHCLREAEVQAALNIPEEWATAAMVPIGYPVLGGHGPITRRGIDQMACDDEFGTPLNL